MNPQTANTLNWLAGILIVTGLAISSPGGAFAVFVLAILACLAPVLRGAGKARIIGGLLLILAAGLAVSGYPAFRHEQAQYRGHATH